MNRFPKIQVFEHDKLVVNELYESDNGPVVFRQQYLDSLAKYLTRNEGCPFYTLYYNKVRFNQYVGVIQIEGLTIEVLPKTDRHGDDKDTWQQVLIQMLQISLQVQVKTTTIAAIDIKKLNVLEAYIMMFLEEVSILMHHGLVKKYRTEVSNQSALKGRLLVHQQATRNLVHAERFYVAHTAYDKNNIYNSILNEALNCITRLSVNSSVISMLGSILLTFPDCNRINITEKTFSRLKYDRKTERYKNAIELAKIIILNYHPDLKGGSNNILAIMLDMNVLWENYIYYILKRAKHLASHSLIIYPQRKSLFWKHPDNWNLRLKPDVIIEFQNEERNIVLDTKWKYRKYTSTEDVRQMYAYSHYFNASESYLVYPDKLKQGLTVSKSEGKYYKPGMNDTLGDILCGLLWVDLLNDNQMLNIEIGSQIISKLISDIE